MNNEMCGCGTEEKPSTAKGLVRINYKEDFELVVELLAGDNSYTLGDEDFRIDFIVMASRYTVGRTDGVCERCMVVDGNKIRCFMDAHGLPPGELRAEVKVNTPDPNYADGKRLSVAIAEGTVLLVKDNTRFDGAVIKANIPVTLVDAYQLAKAHGYKGTIDEYYSTFSDVSALLESVRDMEKAEEARKVAEEERVKAEELRQKNKIAVDNELSETSENAVQNKIITRTLNEHTKQFSAVRNSLAVLWGQTLYGGKSSTDGVKVPEGVTDIVLPDSVTSIGESAFRGCSSLASVTIPNSVTSIGDCAFADCLSLASITIPRSVTSVGESAFAGCSSLASVTIPNSVTSIGDGAFYDCSSLASVTIPRSVTSIGEGAFYSCSSLASVTIPDRVTSIGESAFADCPSLASVTFKGTMKQWGEIDKQVDWNSGVKADAVIHCTDGDIPMN